MHGTIRLPQLMRDVLVRASSYDEDEHQIDVVFTTGATVRRRSFVEGEFDEELVVSGKAVRLDRLNRGAPLLDSHMAMSVENILGSVIPGSARITKGEGMARIQLTRAPEKAGIVQGIRDGAIRSISVGYKVHVMERKERRGQVPLHRAVDWEPMEISVVPIPFDAGAQIRADQSPELFECRVIADRDTVLTRMQVRHAARRLTV